MSEQRGKRDKFLTATDVWRCSVRRDGLPRTWSETAKRRQGERGKTTTHWIYLPETSDEELIRLFDKGALLTVEVYAAMWERCFICYTELAFNLLEKIGER